VKSRDWIGILLAVGICTALNMIVGAVLYDAIFSSQSGLSENATQILTGWGGGIIGILGAMVGYKAGAQNGETSTPPVETPPVETPPVETPPQETSPDEPS
jgi:hypothetical protein